MNDFPVSNAALDDEEQFYALALRYFDGIATAEEENTLLANICSHADIRSYFVKLCRQLGQLHETFSTEYTEDDFSVDNFTHSSSSLPNDLHCPAIFPTSSSLPTSNTPFGVIAFSYAVSTLLLCTALLGAWFCHVPHDNSSLAKSSSSFNGSFITNGPEPESKYVGRITGMMDVKWSSAPNYVPPMGAAAVPLNRRYILESGLLEITYHTGAKVLLKGPCEYKIDSRAGGFLSVGKLVARVEKTKTQAARSSSLFTVTTPTATIIDLGTEFGVEVNSKGDLEVHVFEGKVEVRHGQKVDACRQRLTAGQAVRLSAGDAVGIVAITANRAAFPTAPRSDNNPQNLPPLSTTRGLALWLAADMGVMRDSQDRVAVWRDLSAGVNRTLTHARQLDSKRRPLWVPDAIAGKPAVRFDGISNCLMTNAFETAADQTLFVVFAPDEQKVIADLPPNLQNVHILFSSRPQPSLLLDIDQHRSLMGVVALRGQRHGIKSESSSGAVTSHPLPLHQAVVATYRYSWRERRAELRLDGRSIDVKPVMAPANSLSQKLIGCHPQEALFFAGDIAELLHFNADLSADEIARVEAYLGAKYGISTNSSSVNKETP